MNLLPNFQKEGDLIGSQFLEGFAGKERVAFFGGGGGGAGGGSFYTKTKLKSENLN